MPRGDSTGPMGMGPMTGRQAGYLQSEMDAIKKCHDELTAVGQGNS